MLIVAQRAPPGVAADAQLVLPFAIRSRSRFRAFLASGEELGVTLARGGVLRGGERLLASDGRVIEVVAAGETVSTVSADDARALARAAYHLGNRHVALQIGAGWLRYGHDHVLDDMVRTLGLTVRVEEAAFEPEAGAYHEGGTHAHAHAHGAVHHHADDAAPHSHE